MATPKKPARRVEKAKRKRPYKARRIDWDALTTEYATGGESIDEVARRAGVNIRTANNRAARHGWTAARSAHRAASAAKVAEVKVEWRARTEAELHRQVHDIMLDLLAGAAANAATLKAGGKSDDVKKTVEAVTLAIKTARQTAGLPAEPTGPAPGSTSTGDTVIRRTAPDGSTVVVTVAAPAAPTP